MGTPNGQHRVGDRRRDVFVTRRHAIERAVRLDVVERDALGIEKSLQRADLIGDEIRHFRRCNDHRPAAEALQVGQ